MTLRTYLWQSPSTGRASYILKMAAKTTYANKILKSIAVIRVQTHLCLLQFHSFSIFFGLKNKSFSSGLLLWNWVRKITKWLNWKVILCWNKCYYTYESLSFPFPSTRFENVHKKQQREKMANEISKIHLHQKVDKEKSCRALITLPKFNLFPFPYFQALHKWVQSLWLREKSSIVEI